MSRYILFVFCLATFMSQPPKQKTITTHWCCVACQCGCRDGKPCKCDGISCSVDVKVDDGTIRCEVSRFGIPRKRGAPCSDRPLSGGRTYEYGIIGWVCNDPKCKRCDSENWRTPNFRQEPCDNIPGKHK